jgi:hypothetical protein
MICQSCGIEAPTKYVAFYQNIGVVLMRFHKSIEGKLCKNCIHRYFWQFTTTNVFLGWWGTISFIITPFLILNNLVRYSGCVFMPAVPTDAAPPELTPEALTRLKPETGKIVDLLNSGRNIEEVATEVADRIGVTPGQVNLYIMALIHAQGQQ